MKPILRSNLIGNPGDGRYRLHSMPEGRAFQSITIACPAGVHLSGVIDVQGTENGEIFQIDLSFGQRYLAWDYPVAFVDITISGSDPNEEFNILLV